VVLSSCILTLIIPPSDVNKLIKLKINDSGRSHGGGGRNTNVEQCNEVRNSMVALIDGQSITFCVDSHLQQINSFSDSQESYIKLGHLKPPSGTDSSYNLADVFKGFLELLDFDPFDVLSSLIVYIRKPLNKQLATLHEVSASFLVGFDLLIRADDQLERCRCNRKEGDSHGE
jgi:hypothetical protein